MGVISGVKRLVITRDHLIGKLALLVVKGVTKRRILLPEEELETEAKKMVKGRINNEVIAKVSLVVNTKDI